MNTFKTILYMGFMHGIFTFYIPYQLASRDKQLFDIGLFHFFAFPLWMAGTLIIVQCSIDIIRRGRGTPAHLDPPKELVIAGWYRHVRNPIYFGAVLVHVGTITWFASAFMILYTGLFIFSFHILIVLVEEPVLRHTFGAAYEEYCRRVPRWVPRFKA